MSDVLREYVRKLTNEQIDFLRIRFRQRLCGDLGNIANELAKDPDIDAWLSESTSADEWFQMVDKLSVFVDKESERRGQEERKEALVRK